MSKFVLVPEKWYIDHSKITFGENNQVSQPSVQVQDPIRLDLLNDSNSSKLVPFYDRERQAQTPKVVPQLQPQPRSIERDLMLTGIRKQRALNIYSKIIASDRFDLTSNNTIMLDGSDTNIPVLQLLYNSQTLRQNFPASYITIFKMLNLTDQDFTQSSRKLATPKYSARKTRSKTKMAVNLIKQNDDDARSINDDKTLSMSDVESEDSFDTPIKFENESVVKYEREKDQDSKKRKKDWEFTR